MRSKNIGEKSVAREYIWKKSHKQVQVDREREKTSIHNRLLLLLSGSTAYAFPASSKTEDNSISFNKKVIFLKTGTIPA